VSIAEPVTLLLQSFTFYRNCQLIRTYLKPDKELQFYLVRY
jgi:hypothetical protein